MSQYHSSFNTPSKTANFHRSTVLCPSVRQPIHCLWFGICFVSCIYATMIEQNTKAQNKYVLVIKRRIKLITKHTTWSWNADMFYLVMRSRRETDRHTFIHEYMLFLICFWCAVFWICSFQNVSMFFKRVVFSTPRYFLNHNSRTA